MGISLVFISGSEPFIAKANSFLPDRPGKESLSSTRGLTRTAQTPAISRARPIAINRFDHPDAKHDASGMRIKSRTAGNHTRAQRTKRSRKSICITKLLPKARRAHSRDCASGRGGCQRVSTGRLRTSRPTRGRPAGDDGPNWGRRCGYSSNPSLTARTPASVREAASILAMMFEMCFWAVRGLMPRVVPISLSDCPAVTRWRTVSSRKVSP